MAGSLRRHMKTHAREKSYKGLEKGSNAEFKYVPSSYKTEGEEAGAKDKSIDVDKARKEFVKLANQDGEQEHVPLKDSKVGVVFF